MRRLFMILSLILLCCVPSYALSDVEYLRMKEDSKFAAADRELTRAYNQAKKSMTKDKFMRLKELQREWIKFGRDDEAARLIEDQGYSRLAAYTEVTRFRAAGLGGMIELINSEGDYYNSEGVHLEITWQNPLVWRRFAELSYRGESWLGEGDEDFNGVNEYSGTIATLNFIDDDTVKVETDDAFKSVVGFDAEGIYKRRR